MTAHSEGYYDDMAFERYREIRELGSSSGWPCPALDNEEADEDARIHAYWSPTNWPDYYTERP